MLIHNTALLLQVILLLVAPVLSQQDYTCSPSKPCKLGCCGKNNVCGLGPNYCAPANCTSNCDSKSECDPGWGAQWSQRQKCPLNVCCSQFGFCGTTKDFCGDKKVTPPSCPGGTSANKKIIGYYEGWSTSKACNGVQPENLLYTAYTHLNYAFAFIDPTTFKIANMQDTDDKFMPRLTALKNYNPGLQVWIAIGGWSMNDPDQPTKRTFSQLAASAANQKTFFSSLLSFMDKYGFDGVDIDWEYPVAPERSGAPEDFANFVSFLKNLRGALGGKGLSITLPSSYWYLQNFDIKNMAPSIDWFNMMSYDLHGTWDGTNPYLGPYVQAHTNLTEIDQALDLLWRNDIDPAKVVLGTGFYGRSFTLSNPGCKTPGCGFSAGGKPGRCSTSAGTLMFNEIQEIVANGAQVVTDQAAAVKIVTWDNDQWVSYDDEQTLKMKMDYANGKCLGGVMVWAASTDDYQGTAIRALAKAAGRTDLVSKPLAAKSTNDVGQCAWGECGAACPAGQIPVESSGSNKSPLGIESGCNQGKRNFCCPAKDPPKCSWKGGAPFCGTFASGRCDGSKEIEVAASTDGCWTGHKSLCCEKTKSTTTIGACKWMGAAPICATGAGLSVALGFVAPALSLAFSFQSYGCPEQERPYELTKSKQGEGGQQSCLYNGGFKSFCCPSSTNPYQGKECKWRTGHTTWVQWEKVLAGPLLGLAFNTDCKTGCEPGETTVATDGFGCRSGTYSYYCCGTPTNPIPPDQPEISLCPGPPTTGLTLDPEAKLPNVFLEPDNLGTGCSAPSAARANLTLVQVDTPKSNTSSVNGTFIRRDYEGGYSLSERSLVKRGAREKALALCGPNGQTGSIWTQNHPGAPTVMRSTAKAFTVAKQGVCAALGITALNTLDKRADWVTEHVFEKQEFRDAVQYMTSGKTPTGNIITAGAAPFAGIFDAGGLFQTNWPSANFPSLTFVRNWAGNINDIFTGILGRTADQGLSNSYIANLQVCDSDFNKYKEYIAVAKTFISASEFNKYNPLDRIGVLADVIDTFSYRSDADVVTSYQKSYSSLYTLWGDFARYAQTKGVTYDFAAAWKQVMPDFLAKQVSTAKGTFATYLNSEIAYWASNVAKNSYSPQVVASNAAKLADWKKNIDTLIALPISKMTA